LRACGDPQAVLRQCPAVLSFGVRLAVRLGYLIAIFGFSRGKCTPSPKRKALRLGVHFFPLLQGEPLSKPKVGFSLPTIEHIPHLKLAQMHIGYGHT
jgi:hypothetical protein